MLTANSIWQFWLLALNRLRCAVTVNPQTLGVCGCRLVMSKCPLLHVLLASVSCSSALSCAQANADETNPTDVRALLIEYCYDCHSGENAEANLALDQLKPDAFDGATTRENAFDSLRDEETFAIWQRIYDRVEKREMPPEDYEALRPDDYQRFTNTLHQSLSEVHFAEKQTTLRRLNRREYTNTLNDLFGTNLNLAGNLPADGRKHEFDTVGSALAVSMSQLELYLESIRTVIDAAKVKSIAPPEVKVLSCSYATTREGEKFIGDVWKLLDDGSVVFFRSGGYPSGMLRSASASTEGFYDIEVTGYAYQSTSPITFAIGATTFQRGLERPTFGYYSFAPGPPQTHKLRVWLPHRYMLEITPWGIRDKKYELKDGGIATYTGPGLAIKEVKLTGPITDEFPSRGHKLLFDGLDRQEVLPAQKNQREKSWYVPKFQINNTDPREDILPAITRVASAAFRRPVSSADCGDYLRLYREQLAAGDDVEQAYLTAVAAIFCSPEFLFLTELGSENSNSRLLGDFDLASRLAYMLTRTAPDEQLLAAAAAGRLTGVHGELRSQAERLLGPSADDRFIVDFCDSWLNLREIDFTNPDKNLYPEFDAYLQFSMLAETRQFVRTLIADNLPIKNVVKSDFAMLNNRLAVHYGIDGVESPDIRRFLLPSTSVRGGLLSQGSILKVSANGTNTSPVVRGVFVTERILGQYAPPPPPGVNGVEPDIRGASTLRQLLEKHRDSDSCSNCHAQIDPPGFALEAFNPIGGWRDRYRSLGSGDKVNLEIQGRKVRYRLGLEVDASGNLPGGSTFAGYAEFRDLLAKQQDALAKSLISKLLTFGTGREMGFSDRPEIDKLANQAGQLGYGVRDIILLVIDSQLFRAK